MKNISGITEIETLNILKKVLLDYESEKPKQYYELRYICHRIGNYTPTDNDFSNITDFVKYWCTFFNIDIVVNKHYKYIFSIYSLPNDFNKVRIEFLKKIINNLQNV